MKQFQSILAALLITAGVFSFGSFVYAEDAAAPASTEPATVAAPAEEVVEGEATTVTETEETAAPASETPTEAPATT